NAYSYNRRRLLTGESVKRGAAAAWSIGYGYNGNGHLASLVYPSGLTVSHAPNALGQPTQAGTYATGVSYFPNGAIKAFTYGNGIVHTLTQNARGLPAKSTDCTLAGTCAAANRRLDLQYGYDGHGNVTAITDHTSSGRQTRGMSYDALDRLIQTTSPSVFGTASYAYDVLDNLTTVNVSGGSQARNHTYSYDAATQRLSQVRNTIGGAVVANLTYDVQGNLAAKGTQAYQFDLGNRLRSVPGKETGYEYDGYGRRVHAQTVGSSPILSQYGNAGQLLYQQDQKQGKRIDYVYLGSRLVASRERPLATETATLKYQHTDALGTPVAVTNAAKTAIESSEYEPYGQLVNKALPDGPGFTGHVQDAATGLTNMQQRYYDPTIGLFLSVDPVTAFSSPISQFHRYRYANSNPYTFTDPDGRCPEAPQTGTRICGGGAGNNISTVNVNTSGDRNQQKGSSSQSTQGQSNQSKLSVAASGNESSGLQLGLGTGCMGGADCDFMYNQNQFLTGEINRDEFLDRTQTQGAAGVVGGVIGGAIWVAPTAGPAAAGYMGSSGRIIGHPAYGGRTIQFLRSGKVRFGWGRDGGPTLRIGIGNKHIDLWKMKPPSK
ncbi:hypothetical protein LDO31_18665, partial [Luteimonas sp. XNQY3]